MYLSKSISIDANIWKVWEILSTIENWPRWQRAVSKVSVKSSIRTGAVFHWTTGGMSIRSIIEDIEAPGKIVWTGKALGTRARHAWLLAENGGSTTVETSESMEGWLVSLVGFFDRRFLDKALTAALNDLKTAAELRPAD